MKFWHLSILFVLALMAFAVSQVPLGAVLTWGQGDNPRLTYAKAEGTIWNGRLEEAALGPVALGRVTLRLRPQDIFQGHLRFIWTLSGPLADGRGLLAISPSRQITLEMTTVSGRLNALPTFVPVTGRFEAKLDKVTVSPAGCVRAQGRIKTRPRVVYTADQTWQSPPLAGTLACVGQALSVPLSGEEGSESVTVDARITPNLRYKLALEIGTAQERVKSGMSLIGFEERDGIFAYAQEGSLIR